MNQPTLFPWEEGKPPKKKRKRSKDVISSDADNVHQQDAWLKEQDKLRESHVDVPMRSRRYQHGPNARPDWPANGGLPSLGKDQ